ncbi:MAG: hypothetical protein HOI35_04710 [Woeseia sp.]|jgi:hypothetical protein|nr:hypothetical protein [Woeseia sp.]
MTYTLKMIALMICVVTMVGCASTQQQMSTLEIRSIQTKEYQSASQLIVYKSLINALLDRGFILKASDSEAGVVLASMSSTQLNKGEMASKAVVTVLTYGLNWVFGDNNFEDIVSVDISANVTPLQEITKVRINAVAKRINSSGEIVESEMILDPGYYNSIFDQIDKSVFLEQNLD